MTVDLSIIDTGKSDKPNASEIGNSEKKTLVFTKGFCFLFFVFPQIFIEQILALYSYCIFLMFESYHFLYFPYSNNIYIKILSVLNSVLLSLLPAPQTSGHACATMPQDSNIGAA